MPYNIQYFCTSHIGKVRRINQDNFFCNGVILQSPEEQLPSPLTGSVRDRDNTLFAIFDGMGGEECGEIASLIAAKNARHITLQSDPVEALSQFCQNANAAICRYADKNAVGVMGTTAAMLAFTQRGVFLCNIGDSKILRFSGGVLEQVSTDHVAITVFGQKPPLLQNLGIPPTEMVIDPYFAKGDYQDGDTFLICSDGLTDMVSSQEIEEILSAHPLADAGSLLLEQALANGGKDNITIILCKIQKSHNGFAGRIVI